MRQNILTPVQNSKTDKAYLRVQDHWELKVTNIYAFSVSLPQCSNIHIVVQSLRQDCIEHSCQPKVETGYIKKQLINTMIFSMS